jgi:glycosyltransferase involved in cell wall biosynthesis
MRITVVSNLYPPHYAGGYELGCRDVVNCLRARGHVVAVVTSTFRNTEDGSDDPGVERCLGYFPGAEDGRHDKAQECRQLVRAVKKQSAEVVYFWNQAGLSYWLSVAVRWLGWPVAFYLSDGDYVAWRVGAWLAGPSERNAVLGAVIGETFLVRGRPVVWKQPCHFASEFLRNCATRAGIPVDVERSTVAHWGIEPTLFPEREVLRWPVRRLLYVGQLIPQKGVHTAIAAFGLLAGTKEFAGVELTIAGGGQNPDYEKGLRSLPGQLGIADRVRFLGRVPRSELPAIYAEHEVLLFPSEWEEPFAITPLEAMASGLVVVGTLTGGSGELFRNRETAMTYATGDAADCARAIREVCQDRELAETLARNGRREVLAHHTLDKMVDRIEAGLEKVVGRTAAGKEGDFAGKLSQEVR